MSLFSFCPLYFKNDLDHMLTGKLSNELSLILCVLVAIAVPYLLGSLNFGIIISKLFFHDDIRNHGSGNAGSTNMLRTYGKGIAALTLAGDMLKGALAVLVGALVLNPMAGTAIDGVYVSNTPVDGVILFWTEPSISPWVHVHLTLKMMPLFIENINLIVLNLCVCVCVCF